MTIDPPRDDKSQQFTAYEHGKPEVTAFTAAGQQDAAAEIEMIRAVREILELRIAAVGAEGVTVILEEIRQEKGAQWPLPTLLTLTDETDEGSPYFFPETATVPNGTGKPTVVWTAGDEKEDEYVDLLVEYTSQLDRNVSAVRTEPDYEDENRKNNDPTYAVTLLDLADCRPIDDIDAELKQLSDEVDAANDRLEALGAPKDEEDAFDDEDDEDDIED